MRRKIQLAVKENERKMTANAPELSCYLDNFVSKLYEKIYILSVKQKFKGVITCMRHIRR
jgi:hypothetical protein